ncbi:MAG: hypothetical protein ACQERZ_09740 [Fusobacteriota bacterium]
MKYSNKKTIIFLIVVITIFAIGGYALKSYIHQATIEKNKESPSCQAIKKPDGSDFNWDTVNSKEEFKDCLIELAKNLQSPERMADWLRKQGFSDVNPHTSSTGRVYLNANWDVEQTGKLMPFKQDLRFIQAWLLGSTTYIIQIRYDDGDNVDASAHHNII